MIDLLLILIIAGVTWAVAAEGPWGSAMVLFSVVLSGLLAMNLFVLAQQLQPAPAFAAADAVAAQPA